MYVRVYVIVCTRYHLLFKPPSSQDVKDRLQIVSCSW